MRVCFLGNFGIDYSSESHHAKSLESLGHEVIRLQETQAGSELVLSEALKSDMFVWVHTHGWQTPTIRGLTMDVVLQELRNRQIPTVAYHLDLWLGIQRQRDLEQDPVYKYTEHFFTVDKLMADWFNKNTKVKGHYLPAGVFDQEAIMLEPDNRLVHHNNDVIFVGSKGYHPEWSYRPQLINWLQETYGERFTHIGGDGSGVVRGLALNAVYANSKVAIGDTLCINFDYPYYISDRVFETTGRGGFIIHPYIKGLEDLFDIGKEIVTYTYGNFDELKMKIDYYLIHDNEREAIRIAGHERTKCEHTYKHRWQTILNTVGLSND